MGDVPNCGPHFDMPSVDDDDCCPNCGGEGVVYCCEEEWACIDPEGGCDLCERRCDWCRPSRAALSLKQEGKGNG